MHLIWIQDDGLFLLPFCPSQPFLPHMGGIVEVTLTITHERVSQINPVPIITSSSKGGRTLSLPPTGPPPPQPPTEERERRKFTTPTTRTKNKQKQNNLQFPQKLQTISLTTSYSTKNTRTEIRQTCAIFIFPRFESIVFLLLSRVCPWNNSVSNLKTLKSD